MTLVGAPVAAPVPVAEGSATLQLPFAGGQPVRIIQGYDGGTHQGRSRFGLDLVLANGGTSGASVLSPAPGKVAYHYVPGGGNGCITIQTDIGGGYDVMLCHVLLDRAFRAGEAVSLGQRLGTVGAAGTLGNNGTPHVHLQLFRRAGGRTAVPFAPPDGLPIEGVSLPSTGRANEHGGHPPILSTNARDDGGGGRSAAIVASAPAPAGTAPPAANTARAEPASVVTLGAARVQGAGSCLNVRAAPSREARPLTCLSDGTLVRLVEGPVLAGNLHWFRADGLGWVAAAYLQPDGLAAPTPSAARVAPAATPAKPPPAATPAKPVTTATSPQPAAAPSTGSKPAAAPTAPWAAVVTGAGVGSCLNVRERPPTDAAIVACLPDGLVVAVSRGPETSAGRTWYHLQDRGWAAADYVRAAAGR